MKNQLLAPLQNPLLFADGTPVQTKEDFYRRREEIKALMLELAFGGMPPEPEAIELEPLYTPWRGKKNTYRVHITEKGKTFSFTFTVNIPQRNPNDPHEKFPVLLTGDACFEYLTDEVVQEATSRGFLVVRFNRTEFASDVYGAERKYGIYALYPDLHFSAISAWAWGYSRVIDVLPKIPFADCTKIGISGHSRGGKTTLLAGALDERIAFVNANGSGTHGCGCWRYEQEEPDGKRSELLSDLAKNFPYWLGPDLHKYIGQETKLPYDTHLLKALIAPRAFLETNGTGDIWANPKGSYLTHLAARPVWEFFGCPEKLGTRYREGEHFHRPEDVCAFLDFMEGKSIWQVPEDYRDLEKIDLFGE